MSNASSPKSPQKKNRLADSKSPYLLQHADNPVDWYPWGAEAFAKAKDEDKPIFLSIGYATCHWCHVMEHESFEDPIVAALMNDAFVNIKVDREERPDIDQVYMSVCQMLTGSGGWPLTIIMTPDKKPFFAATYIPKESRYGRIGMIELIPRVEQLWNSERDKAIDSARQILESLRKTELRPPPGTLDASVTEEAFHQLSGRYDSTHGGFGTAPKFPSPHNLIFLTRFWERTGNTRALEMASHTLEEMRLGGMYDQIGFGFHRYSTDAEWLVPHFEKMLYDQAMLTMAYTEAWQATGNPAFKRTVREIVNYVLRDMTSSDGAFFSAEDADSEGEEGLFYFWKLAQVHEILGKKDADFASALWALTENGNYADEIRGERTGRNIPHLEQGHVAVAASMRMAPEEFEKRLEGVRSRLFTAREKRIHPLKDDKVLADWNGLMAAALARAGRVFGEPGWVHAAERSTDFVLTRMRSEDGRLLHRFREGEASIPAFLDDHVFLTTAMLDLYDATLEAKYLARALDLYREAFELFWDKAHGGFFFTAEDNEELLTRQKEVYDGAIPSGNSMAAENLVRLARITGDKELLKGADLVFAAFASEAKRLPSAHTQMITALLRGESPSLEVVIVGDPDAGDTRSLLASVRETYLPHAAVLLVEPGANGDLIRTIAPFAEPYVPVDGKAAAYVCRDFTCQFPTTDPTKLSELLVEAISKPGKSP
jgi:uncharacterized protein YyaL (SSP411 family)